MTENIKEATLVERLTTHADHDAKGPCPACEVGIEARAAIENQADDLMRQEREIQNLRSLLYGMQRNIEKALK